MKFRVNCLSCLFDMEQIIDTRMPMNKQFFFMFADKVILLLLRKVKMCRNFVKPGPKLR